MNEYQQNGVGPIDQTIGVSRDLGLGIHETTNAKRPRLSDDKLETSAEDITIAPDALELSNQIPCDQTENNVKVEGKDSEPGNIIAPSTKRQGKCLEGYERNEECFLESGRHSPGSKTFTINQFIQHLQDPKRTPWLHYTIQLTDEERLKELNDPIPKWVPDPWVYIETLMELGCRIFWEIAGLKKEKISDPVNYGKTFRCIITWKGQGLKAVCLANRLNQAKQGAAVALLRNIIAVEEWFKVKIDPSILIDPNLEQNVMLILKERNNGMDAKKNYLGSPKEVNGRACIVLFLQIGDQEFRAESFVSFNLCNLLLWKQAYEYFVGGECPLDQVLTGEENCRVEESDYLELQSESYLTATNKEELTISDLFFPNSDPCENWPYEKPPSPSGPME